MPATTEEGLAAFSAAVSGHFERARRDFDMGSANYFLLAGRKRQVFMVPVDTEVTLVGVADPAADPSLVAIHLLAVAREILELLLVPQQTATTGDPTAVTEDLSELDSSAAIGGHARGERS